MRFYMPLLACYPAKFRAEFGGEMKAVFATAVYEARRSGRSHLLKLLSRELRKWPAAVLDAHFQERRGKMSNLSEMEIFHPIKRSELVAALTIFLLPPILLLINLVTDGWLLKFSPLLFFGIAFSPLVLAIVKGLPRWSPPYLGVLLFWFMVFGSYRPIWGIWDRITSYGLLFTRDPFSWSPLTRGFGLGVMATIMWIIILLSAVLLVNILRIFPRTRSLWQRIRLDWTQLSFLVYGGVILNILFIFEEYQHDEPWQIASWVILAVGCWLYLRSRDKRQRILILLGGVTLAMWVVAVGKWVLVPIQDWGPFFQRHPAETERWVEFWWTLAEWVGILIVLLIPALLGLLPRTEEVTSLDNSIPVGAP
jgi:hypothetical protein